jgi:predicted ATPase
MKLTQIDITNFRCFESLTVPLQPDVNVFVGVNASGKTGASKSMPKLSPICGPMLASSDVVRL